MLGATMTLSEFSTYSNISEKAILKRLFDIKGCRLIDGELTFPSGTRYPCDKNLKISEPFDRYYAILFAISRERYIDNVYLKISKETFKNMLSELVEYGYIKSIEVENTFGANGYCLTMAGTEKLQSNKNKLVKELAKLLGTFTGAVLETFNN